MQRYREVTNPRISGLPLRMEMGKPAPIFAGDLENETKLVVTGNAAVLDMSKPTDIKTYVAILDGVGKKTVTIRAEDRQWIPEDKKFVVFISWYEGHREFVEGKNEQKR